MPTGNIRAPPALVEDILLKILCSCDIATVLNCSLASRTLNSLATSKYVWLALISDLHRRGFIDLFPEQRLEDFSTQKLLNLVKRAVHGPKTWSTPGGSPPVVAREIVLKPNTRIGPGINTWYNEAQLLPGGQYILFQNGGGLECRTTTDDRLIWEYKPSWSRADVQANSAEMVDDGGSVVILLGIRIFDTIRKNYLEVVKLDLHTGSSTSLLTKAAPDTSYDDPYRRLKLLGDFAIVYIRSLPGLITLQISTSAWSILEVSTDPFDIALVPGHIVVLRNGITPSTIDLKIWRGDALVGGETESGSSIDIIDPVTSIAIETSPPTGSRPNFRLVSLLSPLSHDSSTIWILDSFTGWRPPSVSVTHRYHVSHPRGQALSIAHMLSWGLPPSEFGARRGFSITFAGYADLSRTDEIMSLTGDGVKTVIHTKEDRSHLSPYSGAVTYATWEKIVIIYYE
ncbi:hypothetical protein FPV67DRAFT_266612 [Lyophyllum atratum]|nr:hypothetical protein FPV67DRAFT_266612 [Lyophyllum atratum]